MIRTGGAREDGIRDPHQPSVDRKPGRGVPRSGEETAAEMRLLGNDQDVLKEANPQFARTISRHIHAVLHADPCHRSIKTGPTGHR